MTDVLTKNGRPAAPIGLTHLLPPLLCAVRVFPFRLKPDRLPPSHSLPAPPPQRNRTLFLGRMRNLRGGLAL